MSNELKASVNKYLKKSVRFYKIYFGLFVFSIVLTFVRPTEPFGVLADLHNLAVGLPIFAILFMAPIGLYYSVQSIKRNEGTVTLRWLYLIGHAFFCLLILLLIVAVIYDISKLFN